MVRLGANEIKQTGIDRQCTEELLVPHFREHLNEAIMPVANLVFVGADAMVKVDKRCRTAEAPLWPYPAFSGHSLV